MKGDDGGRSGDKNKVTRNPSYDKKRDTEAGVQKRLSELVRDHCSSLASASRYLTRRQHNQDKSGKDRIMNSSDDKKRLIEECVHRRPLPPCAVPS